MSTNGNLKAAAMPSVEIYTDGGCEPNPGPGGYGVVLIHPRKRAEVSGGFRLTTNNRMEIFAAIAGLELLRQPCKVTLYSDSQYLVKAMTEAWVATWKRKGWWRTRTERPENVDLWRRLDALCQTHQVEFRWVRGHAGKPKNERCDQLSIAALRQAESSGGRRLREQTRNRRCPPRHAGRRRVRQMFNTRQQAEGQMEAEPGLLL